MTKRGIISLIIVISFLIVGGLATFVIARNRFLATEPLAFKPAESVKEQTANSASIISTLLGMDAPRTMLVLFLNNTEIRPGGGFIGSYGVVTLDKGSATALFTDGTENLDRAAIPQAPIAPPKPIKDHLIDRWFFRDSNWSPDFVESTKSVLKFYELEGGQQASAIQTVVGVTPEVLETIMKYVGPITARGKVYTAENITDTLEQAVEIDFHEQGISKTERKAIIGELGAEIVARAKKISPLKWPALLRDMQNLLDERHIILYDKDPSMQKSFDNLGWSGRMLSGAPDKFMFVDANLASLKTDRVMRRSATYEIYRDAESKKWRGRVTMEYKNTGSFDWRTTRYGSYTRWYFPQGTKFISGAGSVKSHKDKADGVWDVAEEQGFVSFGSFIVVEPGTTKTVVLNFELSPKVVAAIEANKYGLLVQKQLGTEGFDLTVHDEFGTSVKGASPYEEKKHFGDSAYDWQGFIRKDQLFEVLF